MTEYAENVIVRNLIEALNGLRDDLDRVELWTVLLTELRHPAPEYPADSAYLLPTRHGVGHDFDG
jgi:hypothetical protein